MEPMYDPLTAAAIGPNDSYPASYWATQGMPQWPVRSTLPQQAEVVIIGAGYTGLNAALSLAKHYNREVVVVEANQLAWGCSGRNAGFVMPSTGRRSYQDWIKGYDMTMAKAIHAEQHAAIDHVRSLITDSSIACDTQHGGYLKLAHSAKAHQLLVQQHELLQQLGDASVLHSAATVAADYVKTPVAHGALHYPQSFAVNPMQLAAVTAHAAADAGARLVTNAPVQHWETTPKGQRLHTPVGSIEAKQVIIASNGYTPNHLHPAIHGRSLPVLSSIIVTRPLSAAQQQQLGLTPAHQFMDTRSLKYYFRLLPDGRLLFGGRGAIRGRDANKPRYAKHLQEALQATFPQLEAVTLDYFWSGWVSVALDDYPRIYEAAPGVFTSMGYCGAGVAFSSLAGHRLAQLASGTALPELPFYQSALPKFPLAQGRRLGQWLYYQWARATA
ncbi:MAG: FAD-dependent oxidoreductase [Idiomarina sp.]